MRMARSRHAAALSVIGFVLGCSVLWPCALSASVSSTVYFRRQQHGPIIAWDNRDNSQIELQDSDKYSRFVGMAMHRPSRRVYWSDSRTIKSASLDSSGSANVDMHVLLGGLARITWIGTNFGKSLAPRHLAEDDALQLTVKGIRCTSIQLHTPERVECLVAIPDRVPFTPASLTPMPSSVITESDCTIRTAHGFMTGSTASYYEMIADGYPSPLVERIEIDTTYVLPHALAVDNSDAATSQPQWLYWSNSADGRIYRNCLDSTAIEVLQQMAWGVRGLAVASWARTDREGISTTVFYSQEGVGTISELLLSQTAPAASVATPVRSLLLRGLHSPRGLALRAAATSSPATSKPEMTLFFTEKTGRIYEVLLNHKTGSGLLAGLHTLLPGDDTIKPESTQVANVQRILTLPTSTRLDGIAVDSKYLYWCETNANVLARAALGIYQRQVLAGGTADSMLSWPRSVALVSNDANANSANNGIIFSEYLGRISAGASQILVVNELHAASLIYLDHQIQASGVGSTDAHRLVYALE